MNIAHIKSKAAPDGWHGVQTLVRRLAACCLIGVVTMAAAQAGPREQYRERDGQGQRDANRGERRQVESRQADERQPRQDDARAYEEARRNQQAQQDQQNAQNNADAFRRSGRLTPDERRDLRRQINEAGADIYQSRRPRR
ncbi:MAG: hypothetical protein V4484_20385 [Pseudomonadota bacterium]